MADSVRDLAAHLALIACQLHQFEQVAEDLPTPAAVQITTHEEGAPGGLGVRCYVQSYRDPDPGRTAHETAIDALRTWAGVLGSDLHLSEARPVQFNGDGRHRRTLETDGVLPTGLHVNVYTLLDYDAGDPAYAGGYIPAADAEPATT